MPEIVYKFSTLENVVCYKGDDLAYVILYSVVDMQMTSVPFTAIFSMQVSAEHKKFSLCCFLFGTMKLCFWSCLGTL
jgi:hypothetical protein